MNHSMVKSHSTSHYGNPKSRMIFFLIFPSKPASYGVPGPMKPRVPSCVALGWAAARAAPPPAATAARTMPVRPKEPSAVFMRGLDLEESGASHG